MGVGEGPAASMTDGKDILDQAVSVEVAVSETGVKAQAKSRAIAALDRMFGGLFDWGAAYFEGKAAARRRSDAHVAGDPVVILPSTPVPPRLPDPAATRRLENKSGVGEATLRFLRDQPINAEDANSGPAQIDEGVFARIERYAEDAATTDLQEKWARVLAAEIRKPGTVSNRAMRLIDEISTDDALAFESLCKHRLDDVMPIALSGELSFALKSALASSGLILDAGFAGQMSLPSEGTMGGQPAWYFVFESRVIGFLKTFKLKEGATPPVALTMRETSPAIPCYVLTKAGREVSGLIETNIEENVRRLATKMAEAAQNTPVLVGMMDKAGAIGAMTPVA
jgi:hypothetical protein